MKCERCGKNTDMFTMSIFNTQYICMECKEKEKQHPRYEEAKRREYEEIKKGNYNFEGIGLE